jgi:hypothetical protein
MNDCPIMFFRGWLAAESRSADDSIARCRGDLGFVKTMLSSTWSCSVFRFQSNDRDGGVSTSWNTWYNRSGGQPRCDLLGNSLAWRRQTGTPMLHVAHPGSYPTGLVKAAPLPARTGMGFGGLVFWGVEWNLLSCTNVSTETIQYDHI